MLTIQGQWLCFGILAKGEVLGQLSHKVLLIDCYGFFFSSLSVFKVNEILLHVSFWKPNRSLSKVNDYLDNK